MPDHPDHEQLAAFQAGDVDRRERLDVEAHLAGCPSCTALVASVAHARSRLTLLEEPDLPPGLHDRLAAAVEAEAAAARPVADGDGAAPRPRIRMPRGPSPAQAPPVPLARPTPWYRRPAAWGAAAALLLAALVVPFLNQSRGDVTAGGGGADLAQEAADPQAAAGIPVLRLAGEVTADTVRSRLAAIARAKAAPGTADQAAPDQAAPGAAGEDGGEAYRSRAPSSSGAPSFRADSGALRSCLPAATADADPAIRPLTPLAFIEGSYQGREATILVTSGTRDPNRVDLWVFPRDDCSAPPLTTERVR